MQFFIKLLVTIRIWFSESGRSHVVNLREKSRPNQDLNLDLQLYMLAYFQLHHPDELLGQARTLLLAEPHYSPDRHQCHLMVQTLVGRIVGIRRVLTWPSNLSGGTVGNAPAHRLGDPGLNPGPDKNFSLKLLALVTFSI